MEKLLHTLIIIHIAGGALSLLSGILPMVVTKGNNTHRLFGKIFFAGMTVVFLTGFTVSLIKNLQFLFLISIFSYYLVASGYRSLYLKKLHRGQKPAVVDWLLNIVAGLFMAGMVVWGIYLIANGAISMGIVSLVFGLVGVRGVYKSVNSFIKQPTSKILWIEGHIAGMVGGYIAAVTAFLVVNNDKYIGLPGLVAWLLPTLLLVPLIIFWSRKYKKG
ncbi:MAG: hypothetical protein M0D57_18045 [Sphingobacteriales bacterium JAD_PAG50586_3]|nr:MAG: hypothetical protein M0D57_18045 [Sphingobacteriales bacterium JAD_PAG50586_3]